jgi:DNA-binding NtrC family response regulator
MTNALLPAVPGPAFRRAPAAPPALAPAEGSAPPEALCVLLVEDERSLRYSLGKGLRRAGWVVETAATGGEAVERVARGGFDAVVVDLRLPDIAGEDVIAFCTETCPEVPVVVATGYATLEAAAEAMRLGARDFLEKPFEVGSLDAVLRREVARPRTGRDERLRARVERRFSPETGARVDDALRAARAADDLGATPLRIEDARRRFEARYLRDLLRRTSGNVAAAARLAGLTRPKMHAKLDAVGLDPRRYRHPPQTAPDAARRRVASG